MVWLEEGNRVIVFFSLFLLKKKKYITLCFSLHKLCWLLYHIRHLYWFIFISILQKPASLAMECRLFISTIIQRFFILKSIYMQLEVDGDVTTQGLDNLKSQTEYDVAVTPVYDSGIGNPMLNQATTGECLIMHFTLISSKTSKCQI